MYITSFSAFPVTSKHLAHALQCDLTLSSLSSAGLSWLCDASGHQTPQVCCWSTTGDSIFFLSNQTASFRSWSSTLMGLLPIDGLALEEVIWFWREKALSFSGLTGLLGPLLHFCLTEERACLVTWHACTHTQNLPFDLACMHAGQTVSVFT